jgi:hypothetical protein
MPFFPSRTTCSSLVGRVGIEEALLRRLFLRKVMEIQPRIVHSPQTSDCSKTIQRGASVFHDQVAIAIACMDAYL